GSVSEKPADPSHGQNQGTRTSLIRFVSPATCLPLRQCSVRLTSLLKRLSSERSSARLFLSNQSNHLFQLMRARPSSASSKSMRRRPGSSPFPVPFTQAGWPLLASTHLRISSWSVIGVAELMQLPLFIRNFRCWGNARERQTLSRAGDGY